VVLRRLAVFAGGFTLEAACAVAACSKIAPAEVVEHVANLVTKSLVAANVGGAIPCYRLLATTRAYALERLVESGDLEQVERRHAEYESARTKDPAVERRAAGGRWVDERRGARSCGRGWEAGRRGPQRPPGARMVAHVEQA
jgi:predicted ATPase